MAAAESPRSGYVQPGRVPRQGRGKARRTRFAPRPRRPGTLDTARLPGCALHVGDGRRALRGGLGLQAVFYFDCYAPVLLDSPLFRFLFSGEDNAGA